MTQGIPPLPEERPRRRVGRTKPESKLWWLRYRNLKAQGFVHREASQLAEGKIATREMLRGRRIRRRWYAEVRARGLTDAQIEEAIDEMYDEFDWLDAYTQFYAGEEGEE